MNTTYATPEAVQFFYDHAGYCTPPGREACAVALAEAETKGRDRGLRIEWDYDDCDPDWGDISPTDEERAATLNLWAACYNAHDNVLASLGGILVPSFDDPYCRVIEAELLMEAL